jgi:hypothetical protein
VEAPSVAVATLLSCWTAYWLENSMLMRIFTVGCAHWDVRRVGVRVGRAILGNLLCI